MTSKHPVCLHSLTQARANQSHDRREGTIEKPGYCSIRKGFGEALPGCQQHQSWAESHKPNQKDVEFFVPPHTPLLLSIPTKAVQQKLWPQIQGGRRKLMQPRAGRGFALSRRPTRTKSRQFGPFVAAKLQYNKSMDARSHTVKGANPANSLRLIANISLHGEPWPLSESVSWYLDLVRVHDSSRPDIKPKLPLPYDMGAWGVATHTPPICSC